MYSSSSSRGRSSSPFSYRKPPSPSSYSSSSSSSSSFYNGRIIPRSSPSSVSSHYFGSSNGVGARSVTPTKSRSMRTPPPPPLLVPFPSADELVIEDTSRSGDSISVTIRFRPLSEREIQRGDEISWYADGEKLVRSEYNPATAYAYG